jgi:hypothetical protein
MGVNLNEKLLHSRRKRIQDLEVLSQVYKILENDSNHEADIKLNLSKSQTTKNNKFNLESMETDKIFHIEDIKSICITYRLRFLDSSLFKAEIPSEAIHKIKKLERDLDTCLKGYKIMAPSKLFKLKNYDDPLLFAPIGNDYYYLIHKWGNDLSTFRKWLMWPFRNFETLLFTAVLVSFLITAAVPDSLVNYSESPANFFLLFLFMTKWVIGIIIYYAFARGKNFNSAIWDSRYINS